MAGLHGHFRGDRCVRGMHDSALCELSQAQPFRLPQRSEICTEWLPVFIGYRTHQSYLYRVFSLIFCLRFCTDSVQSLGRSPE